MSEQTFFRKHLGWVVTGFLTLLLWIETCHFQKQIRHGKDQITKLELERQELNSMINRQGKTIHSQDAIIVDNTQALNNLTDSIFDLKKKDKKNTETLAYFRNKTATVISEIEIPYLDSVSMKRFEDSVASRYPELASFVRDSVITVPRTSTILNKNFNIIATAKKNGITIDSLFMPDELQLRFVEHKGNLFKSQIIEAQFFHSNQYIHSLSANSVFYKPKKASFFKRVILPVAVGVGAGILISK